MGRNMFISHKNRTKYYNTSNFGIHSKYVEVFGYISGNLYISSAFCCCNRTSEATNSSYNFKRVARCLYRIAVTTKRVLTDSTPTIFGWMYLEWRRNNYYRVRFRFISLHFQDNGDRCSWRVLIVRTKRLVLTLFNSLMEQEYDVSLLR